VRQAQLIAVVRRFVGPLYRKIQVLGLSVSKFGKFDIELRQMSSCNFLIKLLGEHVHTQRELLRGGPKRNLREDLIAKGAGHDEGGVSSGTAQVDKSTSASKMMCRPEAME